MQRQSFDHESPQYRGSSKKTVSMNVNQVDPHNSFPYPQNSMVFMPVNSGQQQMPHGSNDMPHLHMPHGYQRGPPQYGHQPMHHGPVHGMHPQHHISPSYNETTFNMTPVRDSGIYNFNNSLEYTNSLARATNQEITVDPPFPFGDTHIASPEGVNDSWFSQKGYQKEHSLLKPGRLGPDVANLDDVQFNKLRDLAQQIKLHQKRLNDRHLQVDEVGRNNALRELVTTSIDYIHESMNNGQLDTEKDRRAAVQILKHCLDIISDCKAVSQGNAIFGYFFLETTNLIAQLLNLDSDIEGSLQYLLQALEHTKIINSVNMNFQGVHIQRFDLIHSTIIPELLWNICQAQQYLSLQKDAIKSSKMCYDQTVNRVNIVNMRLKDPHLDNHTRQRFSQLLESLCSYQFKARMMKARTLVQMKKFEKSIEEFKNCQVELHQMSYFQGSQVLSQEINESIKRVFEEMKSDKLRQFEVENQKIEEEKRKIRQRMHEIETAPNDYEGGFKKSERSNKQSRSSSPEMETKSIIKDVSGQIISVNQDLNGNRTAESYNQREEDKSKTNVKKIKTKNGIIKVINKYVPSPRSSVGPGFGGKSKTVDDSIIKEVQKLRQEMKKRDLETINSKIDNLKTKSFQTEQLICDQLEHQKKIIVEQQEVRFREEIEQYKQIYEQRQFSGQQQSGNCSHWGCTTCNPPPSSNANQGRPIYDPCFKCWTYPYAQNNPLIIYDQPHLKKPKVHKKKPKPKAQPQVQPPPPKPVKVQREIQTQTFHEIQTQTCEDKEVMATPVYRDIIVQVQPRVDREAALRIIIRFFKKIVLSSRYQRYKNIRGLMLCKDYNIGETSGALEILSVLVIYNTIDYKCMFIRFCLFDYQTKLYKEIDAQFENIHIFNAYKFVDLARPALKPVPYERQPFRLHIGTIKQVINDNLPAKYVEPPSPSSSSSSSSSSSKQSEPEQLPIIIPEVIQTRPEQIDTDLKQTQTNWPEEPSPRSVFEDQIFKDEFPDLKKPKDKPLNYINRTVYVMCKIKHNDQPCFHKCSFTVTLYKMMKKDHNIETDQNDLFDYFYRLEAVEDKWSYLQRTRLHQCQNTELMTEHTDYYKIRLPENDHVMLQNYLKLGVVIEVESYKVRRCRISILKLLRLKIHKSAKVAPPKIRRSKFGCDLIFQFYLRSNQITGDSMLSKDEINDFQECSPNKYLCKVYRRAQWADDELQNRKYKDYKIKVIQDAEPKSQDIIFLHKLPTIRSLDEIKAYLRNPENFQVVMNSQCMPRIIKYLKFTKRVGGKEVKVYSLQYQDQQDRKSREFIKNSTIEKHYFNQTYNEGVNHFNNLIESRMPEVNENLPTQPDRTKIYNLCPHTQEDEKTVLYEIMYTSMVPKKKKLDKILMYYDQDGKRHSENKNNSQKQELKSMFYDEQDVYSSEESEDDSTTYKQAWAWNEKELARIQLDRMTIGHEYVQIWCTNTSDPLQVEKIQIESDDVRNFIKEQGDMYQFFIQNLLVSQVKHNTSLRLHQVCLRIRKPKELFDYSHLDSIRDKFRAQDKNRTKMISGGEQDIVTSMYDFNGFQWHTPTITKGYLIQSCMVGNYNIRGQIWVEKLFDLSNEQIEDFLDKCITVVINHRKNEDSPHIKTIIMNTQLSEFNKYALKINRVKRMKEELKRKLLGNSNEEEEDELKLQQMQENNLINVLKKNKAQKECNRELFLKLCDVSVNSGPNWEYACILFDAFNLKEHFRPGNTVLNKASQTFKDVFIDGEELEIFDIIREKQQEPFR